MMFLSFSHLQKSVHISSIIHLQVPLSLFNLHFIGFDTMTPPESFGQALRPSFEAGQAAIRTSKAFEGEAAAVEGWGDVYIYNIHISTELLYLYNEDIYIYTYVYMYMYICTDVDIYIYIHIFKDCRCQTVSMRRTWGWSLAKMVDSTNQDVESFQRKIG